MRIRGSGAFALGWALIAADTAGAQDKVVLPHDVKVLIEAYTDCTKAKDEEWFDTSDTSEIVIDRAIAFCADWRDTLRDELMLPPLNASLSEADSAVRQMTGDLRPTMIETLKQARGF